MIISVYGAGYVGLVSSACFAKLGHQVICADINENKITKLKLGECPIYEDQLPQLLREQSLNGRLHFTSDLSFAIQQGSVHVIATGTPSLPDGHADLSQVFSVARKIARETNRDTLLVTKSTVPVGTGDEIESCVQQELLANNKPYRIDVVSNPEFLREGSAVHDFLQADRIIIGGDGQALETLMTIYQPLVDRGVPLVCMERRSAELAKYAANAMLACKISFINQISRISEKVDANIEDIRIGIGLDKRIGPHFLNAGIGYGGSCFPKDCRALIQVAHSLGIDASLLDAIEKVNHLQKSWIIEQLNNHFDFDLRDRTISVWGLAFKPGTDDMREANSLITIETLLRSGTKLRLYDPIAMHSAQKVIHPHDSITWCNSLEESLTEGIDALVIATEWPMFKEFPLADLAQILGTAPIIDGRNCFNIEQVKAAKIFYYYSVGRPSLRLDR